jgi:hypothetical protein
VTGGDDRGREVLFLEWVTRVELSPVTVEVYRSVIVEKRS